MFSFGITMWELLIVCCLIFRSTKGSVAQVDGAAGGARAQPVQREGRRVLPRHHDGVAAPSLLSTLHSDRCPFAGAGGWRQR